MNKRNIIWKLSTGMINQKIRHHPVINVWRWDPSYNQSPVVIKITSNYDSKTTTFKSESMSQTIAMCRSRYRQHNSCIFIKQLYAQAGWQVRISYNIICQVWYIFNREVETIKLLIKYLFLSLNRWTAQKCWWLPKHQVDIAISRSGYAFNPKIK